MPSIYYVGKNDLLMNASLLLRKVCNTNMIKIRNKHE